MLSYIRRAIVLSCVFASSVAMAEAGPGSWHVELAQRISSGERLLASGQAPLPAFVHTAHSLLTRADAEDPTAVDDRRRALDLGLQAFSALPGFEQAKEQGIEWVLQRTKAVAKLPSGLAHVTFVAYCTLIPTLSLFSQLPAAHTCREALERSVAVDPAFESGASMRALALFHLRAPLVVGGSTATGLVLAERALKLAADFAPNRLVMAKVRFAIDGDEDACVRRLREIVALPDDPNPDRAVHQRRAKADAARRLESADCSP